jgi:phytoene dehydrogenase-like protein
VTVKDAQDLATRYIALWTEPDPELRRKAIQKLWSDDGVHILQPPADLRERAAGLGFDTTTLEAHGYDALEVRVMRSHAEFVAPGQYTFQARDNAARLHNVVKFTWEMVPVGGGDAVGGGLEVLILDTDGRIKTDYMFPGL